jgi:hypothetical protein
MLASVRAGLEVGVDFDNTIVCYDGLFHTVCVERELIPASVPTNKSDVRNYLRRIDREDDWTEMQGYVYGARMLEAEPYPGVLDFFRQCREYGIPTRIISHKTLHPFRGEAYDLHGAATEWLYANGFFDRAGIGLSRERVHFEVTKGAKLSRIAASGCTRFIDDLPEFLGDDAFPSGVERILFDPNDLYAGEERFARATSWDRVWTLVRG